MKVTGKSHYIEPYLTRENRERLNCMSKILFGSSSRWRTMLKRGVWISGPIDHAFKLPHRIFKTVSFSWLVRRMYHQLAMMTDPELAAGSNSETTNS